MASNPEVVNLDYPLSRFFLKPRLWMWEAWQYGWKFDHDEQPDRMIGCYFTREKAMQAIEDREAYEKEHFGVWRFFVD